ncbi:hypothetical protein M3Y94_00765700 [Aphelenchoides besseyi]|nr:hypothetical protein M3Y94_00765700 [Aphelenchoides besseyi]
MPPKRRVMNEVPIVEKLYKKNQEDYNAAGGFDAEDDHTEERRARIAEMAQKKRDREAQIGKRPDDCVDCERPLIESFLWDSYNHPVCNDCRKNDNTKYKMISRTNAKKDYVLKDEDLDIRRPILRYISKKNPNNPRYGDMKLYLELQIRERATVVHGSLEILEDTKEMRQEKKRRNGVETLRKQNQEMRADIKLDDNAVHEHEFGAEKHVSGCDYEQIMEEDELVGDFEDGNVKQMQMELARQISTGQVVVTLRGACRELIDNALDAGATSIEIRASEHGGKQLEVHDNGTGIQSSNFKALCKPHSTSKLGTMSDFDELLTFGFRGEALNALAALSKLTITTRHKSEPIATKLVFSPSGDILEQSKCPRQVGTTVSVVELFKPMAVRRKEFLRNTKPEFIKLIHSVQSFALSRPDVRFAVSNAIGSKINKVLTTTGTDSTLTTITNLFGPRTGKNKILEIKNATPDGDILSMYGLKENETTHSSTYDPIDISGYVSSCEYESGHQGPDQQFVFINKRPVDYIKMCKVANEVYKGFNRNKYCTLVLFIALDPAMIDVNVTPDKRIVFLKNEREVFAKLRACLLHTFESLEGKVPQSRILRSTQTQPFPKGLNEYTQVQTKETKEKATSNDNQRPITEAVSISLASKSRQKPLTSKKPEKTVQQPPSKRQRTLEDFNFAAKDDGEEAMQFLRERYEKRVRFKENNQVDSDDVLDIDEDDWRESNQRKMVAAAALASQDSNPTSERNALTDYFVEQSFRPVELDMHISNAASYDHNADPDFYRPTSQSMQQSKAANKKFKTPIDPKVAEEMLKQKREKLVKHSDLPSTSRSSEPKNPINVNSQLQGTQSSNATTRTLSSPCDETVDIEKSTNMMEEVSASEAEQHLSLMLNKEDFSNMLVIGQFNNAFILTRLGSHMFIVDQHASDEKYNFEQLQANERVQCQLLLRPKCLKLGAMDEAVLEQNLEIFEANGFRFEFHPEEDIGNRIQLTAIPVVSGFQMDENDIDEMLGVLADQPSVMYRPLKLRKIFASRACRKSIMFGTALNRQQCTTIIRHMATMDSPWNCPHGRPTLRHLCTLKYAVETPLTPTPEEPEKENESANPIAET